MKCISVKQPHAHAIIHGLVQPRGILFKPCENRTWPTKVRGRIAIHACKFDPKELRETLEWWKDLGIADALPTGMVYGAVIGTVEIYDCVTRFDSMFFVGPYAFLLREPRPLEPVTVAGSLGFWEWDGEVTKR